MSSKGARLGVRGARGDQSKVQSLMSKAGEAGASAGGEEIRSAEAEEENRQQIQAADAQQQAFEPRGRGGLAAGPGPDGQADPEAQAQAGKKQSVPAVDLGFRCHGDGGNRHDGEQAGDGASQ